VDDPLVSLVWYGAFLFSVTLHEAAHAWAAKRGGDLTAYRGGQVSIDPRPHIRREPFGMVILPVLSLAVFGWPFGYASTPYDPRWAQRFPRRAAWMSLAGPAANLALLLAAGLAIRIGMASGLFESPSGISMDHIVSATGPGATSALALALSVFFSLNLILATLNLMPIPPLDGSGALPLVLSTRAAHRLQELLARPMLSWIGILVAWNLFGSVFRPLFLLAVNLLHPGARRGPGV
jgi:Zn-dependent protease